MWSPINLVLQESNLPTQLSRENRDCPTKIFQQIRALFLNDQSKFKKSTLGRNNFKFQSALRLFSAVALPFGVVSRTAWMHLCVLDWQCVRLEKAPTVSKENTGYLGILFTMYSLFVPNHSAFYALILWICLDFLLYLQFFIFLFIIFAVLLSAGVWAIVAKETVSILWKYLTNHQLVGPLFDKRQMRKTDNLENKKGKTSQFSCQWLQSGETCNFQQHALFPSAHDKFGHAQCSVFSCSWSRDPRSSQKFWSVKPVQGVRGQALFCTCSPRANSGRDLCTCSCPLGTPDFNSGKVNLWLGK